MMKHSEPSVIDIQSAAAASRNISLSMLDISTMHPLASGNKLFKLALNIDDAIEKGFSQMVSFGGAYSNHIYALALYGRFKGIKTIGIIRGEPEYASNPTLRVAKDNGMMLHFVDRKTYRLRNEPLYLDVLAKQYPDAVIIPEGGSNALAVDGCKLLAEIINNTLDHVDSVAVACGTGGTLAGLVSGLDAHQKVLGFPVVTDGSLASKIESLLAGRKPYVDYQLIQADYGGYAKFDKRLLDFILDWLKKTGVLLDPIYTSKMCLKLLELIEDKQIEEGQHICLIHTGGLQAWYGMRDKVVALGGESAWTRIQAFI